MKFSGLLILFVCNLSICMEFNQNLPSFSQVCPTELIMSSSHISLKEKLKLLIKKKKYNLVLNMLKSNKVKRKLSQEDCSDLYEVIAKKAIPDANKIDGIKKN